MLGHDRKRDSEFRAEKFASPDPGHYNQNQPTMLWPTSLVEQYVARPGDAVLKSSVRRRFEQIVFSAFSVRVYETRR